jgi:hypothetical protein
VAINIVGVSGKNFSSLGKIVVCPEKFFDSQNGTLTDKGPPTQNMPKGPVFLRYATESAMQTNTNIESGTSCHKFFVGLHVDK